MFSLEIRSRAATAFVIVQFLFLLFTQGLPAAAKDELKKTQVPDEAQVSAPRSIERQAAGASAPKHKNRLLPSLLGLAVAGAVVAVLVLTVFKKNGYNPHIVPPEFVQKVDNVFFPLTARRILIYTDTAGASIATRTVSTTVQTKLIMGVLCLGVQEREIASDKLTEDTWRWYAQDRDGNVWYFAGETKKYNNDVVTEDWSWQAGVNGAKPGKVMLGKPQDFLNQEYWQAYAPGKDEEKAQVLSVNETVTVPCGTYSGCVKVKVFSGIGSGSVATRYYAPGIGLVLSESVQEGGRRIELVSMIEASSPAEKKSLAIPILLQRLDA